MRQVNYARRSGFLSYEEKKSESSCQEGRKLFLEEVETLTI